MSTASSRRPRWWIIAANIFDNYRSGLNLALGRSTLHGATHLEWNPEESLAYIRRVFLDYFAYAELPPESVCGQRILEIGPGDNLGVALTFIAHGASQVCCFDRFIPERDDERNRRVYSSLRASFNAQQRRRFDDAVQLEPRLRINPDKLHSVYGIAIEDAGALLEAGSFDMIVSRAVLMEITSPEKALHVLDRLLRPGGYSIHKISPLNDYQILRSHGYHPLEFLTIHDIVYDNMVSYSGKPNRKPLEFYRTCFSEPEYSATFHVTKLLGSAQSLPAGTSGPLTGNEEYRRAIGLLGSIRPRLAKRFRALPDEDLTSEDVFIVARKLIDRD